MIGAVTYDENGACHASGDHGDQPWPGGVVWSLVRSSRPGWVQVAAKQAEDCQQMRREIAAAIEAYQAIPRWMRDFLAPYIGHAEGAAWDSHAHNARQPHQVDSATISVSPVSRETQVSHFLHFAGLAFRVTFC